MFVGADIKCDSGITEHYVLFQDTLFFTTQIFNSEDILSKLKLNASLSIAVLRKAKVSQVCLSEPLAYALFGEMSLFSFIFQDSDEKINIVRICKTDSGNH